MHELLNRIEAGCESCRRYCPQAAQRCAAVSVWSVGQQLDHVALVNAAVLAQVNGQGLLDETDKGWNLLGFMVMTSGWIPRGKGPSPDIFKSQDPDYQALAGRFRDLSSGFAALAPQMAEIEADRRRFPHPAFGGFTRRDWLRLVDIHQRHHLKIMRDIVARG